MITIYSKDNCSFCDKAKNLLRIKQIAFEEFKIGRDITREEVLEQFPYQKTVPIILDEGRLIGGYDNLLVEVESNPTYKRFLQE
jgi:glutaredoxin